MPKMDALLTGHAHRSSSDRLLNNYLDSQKSLTTSLLTLLSHSHTSTSSLLAYVTSSPGVLLSVRRAVKHAAFEGPISSSTHDNLHADGGNSGTPGWAAYVSSLEDFRRDLKQIHLLEEEMSRVKRDREILVTRLIKTTKSRPTKSDIKAMADTLVPRDGSSVLSSEASIYSHNSDVSVNNREAKRASKLAEAQAELLGCEEHLRSLEVRVETERNKVMYRGLEERFRAMEAVGQMWMNQARRGLADLDKLPDLPHNAFELESNGSIAPSQSASQVGYEDGPSSLVVPASSKRSSTGRHVMGMRAPEVANGSIAEEEEGGGSSDDEPQGTLVMHTNVARPAISTNTSNATAVAPRLSSPRQSPLRSSPVQTHSTSRRATSDVGAMAPYNPPRRSQQPLRRTVSNEIVRPPASDTSSIRSGGDGKKKGFFSSIARFFKGPNKSSHHQGRSGRASPTRGTWSTRTDSNLRSNTTHGSRRRRIRSDSSSDEDDMSNFVAVSNVAPEFGGWSVADVGRESTASTPRPGVKRSASARSKSTVMSQSTVTARNRPFSPTLPPPTTIPSVSRSSTVKTAKSGTVVSEKTRKNGSIARSKSARNSAVGEKNIMSLVDMPPPAMPDVPKAPQSQLLGPHMELAKAPGSSIVPSNTPMLLPSQLVSMNRSRQDEDQSRAQRRHDDELRPSDSVSRSNSTRTQRSTKSTKSKNGTTLEKRRSLAATEKSVQQPEMPRPVSPLPPSKMRSPPLKSALRPTSPVPPRPASPPPVITTLYSIAAPGPVQLPREPEPEIDTRRPSLSRNRSSNNTANTGDELSIYESAEEDGRGDDSDDDEETELGEYTVVANDIAKVADGYAMPDEHIQHLPPAPRQDPVMADVPSAPMPVLGAEEVKLGRRKSVRIAEDEDGASHDVESKETTRLRERDFASEPAFISTAQSPRASRKKDDSPPPTRVHETWDTRIGRVRDDSSDDEDEGYTKDYTRARKGLIKNNGDYSDVAKGSKKKRDSGLKKSFSLKSKGSTRSASSRR